MLLALAGAGGGQLGATACRGLVDAGFPCPSGRLPRLGPSPVGQPAVPSLEALQAGLASSRGRWLPCLGAATGLRAEPGTLPAATAQDAPSPVGHAGQRGLPLCSGHEGWTCTPGDTRTRPPFSPSLPPHPTVSEMGSRGQVFGAGSGTHTGSPLTYPAGDGVGCRVAQALGPCQPQGSHGCSPPLLAAAGPAPMVTSVWGVTQWTPP